MLIFAKEWKYVNGISLNRCFDKSSKTNRNDLCHNLKRGRAGGHWRIVAKHERALQVIEPLVKV